MIDFNLNRDLEDALIEGAPASNILFFDFEWIPNYDLIESIAGHYKIERSSYDSLIPPGKAVSDMKADDFKEYIASMVPCQEWLVHAEAAASVLKGKKLVTEAIQKELSRSQRGNIPSEVLSMNELQTIVTLSWSIGYSPVEQLASSEKEICEKLAEIMLQNLKPAGWAIRTSDIPMFLAACARNKVNPLRSFDLKHGSDILDMYEIRFGRGNKGKLSDLSIVTGFQCDNTDPLKDGSEVADAHQEGRLEDIMLHNKIDILKLQHVHRYYSGVLW